MNIKGIDKAQLLCALFNSAKPLGLGHLNYKHRDMKVVEAMGILKSHTYFDYLEGRVMKVDLSHDELYTGLYNRDNGTNAAETACAHLLSPIGETDVKADSFTKA